MPGDRAAPSRDATVQSGGAVTDRLDAGYTTFFRAEFPMVVRSVYLILRDQARAEDVVQEAFIQLLANWEKVSAYERPEAWVRRVAVRLAMRGVRRDRLWIRVKDRIAPPRPQVATDLDLSEAIRRLPGNQRAAIALYYYEDRPVEEVAAILGCSEATVRVHLHRGRRRLAAFLGEEADDGL
jgi:RNA polymerase sigma-70 factor (ECF subfamily)